MTRPDSRLSEAEAHQELMLMDSRVSTLPLESFLDRIRRLDLPYADVLARFREVLAETRVCGGKHVHLGKILGNDILEFMESDPDVPAGVQLDAALRGLLQLAPHLSFLLASLSAEVESQGFGKALVNTAFREKLGGRAVVFFRRTADILNLTKHLLQTDQSSATLDVVTFEEPSLFELDSSENPFDLDDLSNISPTCLAVAKILIKISLADGDLRDEEKIMIAQTLEHMGESLSESQCERLAAEASRESIPEILKAIADQPVIFREKLLLLAMLATAADGRIETIEKKLLAQTAPVLGISKQRFSEIGKDAVVLIKTRQSSLVESAGPIAREAARISPARPALEPVSAANSTPVLRAGVRHETSPAPATPPPPAHVPAARPAPADHQQHAGPPARTTRPVRSPEEARPVSSQEPPPAARMWRCPACNMPQFQSFDECPQCGVIVSKFLDKHDRHPDSREGTVEVPVHAHEPRHEENVHQEQDEERRAVAGFCATCGVSLPAGAKFCPSCGTRAM
jgi:uncharacterized tellurite resistance protein B-like protein